MYSCKYISNYTFQGPELMEELGGLHKFMNWNRALLTVINIIYEIIF